jgi:tripartite-type tricarboxylate transporter receptor subunit TctC
MKKCSVAAILIISLVLLFSASGLSQTFPTKPVTLLINSAPGQLGDVTTRATAAKAEKFLGQPFAFVNNNAGGGAVAFGMIKKVKPDGYTIMSTATGNLIWLPFTRSVDYKLEDYMPLATNLVMTSGVVVKADSPFKTFKDLVAYAKQNPGKVNYAITSAGVPMDIAMQFVAKQEGIRWTAVPTPGSDPNTMLLGGHVTAYSGSTSWLPHVKSGAFRLLIEEREYISADHIATSVVNVVPSGRRRFVWIVAASLSPSSWWASTCCCSVHHGNGGRWPSRPALATPIIWLK